MKTVVISDTHLSDKLYPKKYHYLKSIIENADKVIIAGDFWDGFLTSFDSFVNSRWQSLFPLLLEKQAVYLYGNHDRPEWCDERVSLFSTENGMSTTLSLHNQTYHITHGHTIFVSKEEQYPIFNHRLPLRIGSCIDITHKFLLGSRFLKNGNTINAPLAQWVDTNLASEHILITGHSHYPEINLANRFMNSGFIGTGYGNYIAIDASGPRVVKERY